MKLDDSEDFINDSSDEFNEDGICPEIEHLLPVLFTPKPFGVFWKREKMTRLLKARGWKIAERYDDESGEYYQVAYKKGEKNLPEEDNIMEVFMDEIQDAIIDLLTKK